MTGSNRFATFREDHVARRRVNGVPGFLASPDSSGSGMEELNLRCLMSANASRSRRIVRGARDYHKKNTAHGAERRNDVTDAGVPVTHAEIK